MKKSFPWLFLIIGIFFATISWQYISFPYDETNTIVGEYSKKKINPLNDTVRGLFFIFFPLLLYFIFYFSFNRKLIKNIIFQEDLTFSNTNINYLSYILILFSIVEFYTLDYKNFLGNIDVHHEGTYLTAQLNLLYKKGIWTGTLFDYGFLGNSIGIFFNFLFAEYNIGIQRFSFKFLILFNKILIILICKKIIDCLNSSNHKELLFLIFSLLALTLVSFYEQGTPFHKRIFLYLIFTLLSFVIVSSKSNNIFVLLVSGSFSLISFLFYWDLGTYINVIICFLLTYLFITKRYSDFYKILIGIIFSWFLFLLFTPQEELREFVNQYFFIISISDYLLGIEFPQPFSDKSTRHTKALLFIILSGIFLINYIFDKNKKESLQSKFLLFYLFISSIIFFKSGLMRSDSPHIKYTSGPYTLLIFFFITYYLINITSKLDIINKIYKFFGKKTYFLLFSFLVCCLFFFKNNYLNLMNLFDSEKNFHKITKIKDENFLNDEYKKFIKIFKDLTKNETCVQQFTDDNSIPYLVNKPTCTKYYVHAHVIQNWTENDFIKELNDSMPNYIVYSSQINWFKYRYNAPKADKFIKDNYSLYKDLSPWIIYKKR
tara:strand:- start:12 stop:1817 length:1806 start_codon:yes stop_codon:yes gene_type:complete